MILSPFSLFASCFHRLRFALRPVATMVLYLTEAPVSGTKRPRTATSKAKGQRNELVSYFMCLFIAKHGDVVTMTCNLVYKPGDCESEICSMMMPDRERILCRFSVNKALRFPPRIISSAYTLIWAL